MATPSTLLTLIDAAIEALLTGQHESYSIGSRSVTRLDLKTLFEERALLEMQVNRANSGAMRVARIQGTSR
tara:strand:+ start:30 stop:242 length:213 start_codon:yes stop_codon:yes gene_type:complete